MKRTSIALAVAAFTAISVTPAGAHVTVQPNEAIAESFAKFVVRVPNERDDASTTKIEVGLPPLAFTSFQDVPGWEREEEKVEFDEPLEAFGSEITEGVGTVTWTGGEIAPGEFAEFPFSAAMPAGEEELVFDAIQTYDSGEVVEWVGEEDSDEPAARVSTVAFGGFAAEGAGELGVLNAVVEELEELRAEGDDGSDAVPLVLGALGAVLGAIALAMALRTKT
ncbi:MAG: YcnI family protein [Actinomycetota bacterium]